MIIEPNVPASLDFSLNNPSDPTTYYVQAKVRAVVANTVIGTYNMTLVTGQYYRSPWTTPVDNSGTGYEIAILFSVYTDAAYTQLSPVYGTTMEKFIVRHLAAQNLGGFTRGADVDYKKLEKMIQKAIEGISFPKADQKPMEGGFDSLMKLVSALPAKFSGDLKQAVRALASLADERHEDLKNHITEAVNETGNELSVGLKNHEQNSNERHIAHVGATNDVSEKLDAMDGKIPEPQEDIPGVLPPTHAVMAVGKKVDELKDMIGKHHDESIKEIRKPVNLNLGQRPAESEEKPKDSMSDLVAFARDHA